MIGLLFFVEAQARVYKCSVNGKIAYSNTQCAVGSVEKKTRFSKSDTNALDDALIRSYLGSPEPETDKTQSVYKQFYDVFNCKGFKQGMSRFPHRDTVSYIAHHSFKEPYSPTHKLMHNSTAYYSAKTNKVGKKCFMNLSRDSSGRLQFGIVSYSSTDTRLWTTQKVASKLSMLGYKFKQTNDTFLNAYDYEWSARGVECEIKIRHRDDDIKLESISIFVKCKLD